MRKGTALVGLGVVLAAGPVVMVGYVSLGPKVWLPTGLLFVVLGMVTILREARTEAEQQVVENCPDCGAPNDPDAGTCDNCGEPL